MFEIADNEDKGFNGRNESKNGSSNHGQSPINMGNDANTSSSCKGAKIRVIGVGGAGGNAVNTMISAGLSGVEYIAANSDSQALDANLAPIKVQLGREITKGLGAGANPEVGRKAALEEYERLSELLSGADMVFITAGMGGGTGTGAAPVIAKLAKELGALTVGVVTKPFMFEGKKRARQAEAGMQSLEEAVDSLITIPNQRLLLLAGENLSLIDTFKKADEVLLNAVRGISDLINHTGLINADFADVSTVMGSKGLALMGTGVAAGPDRAIKAASEAINSPLLEDITIDGATGIIINITGNKSLTTHETNAAVTLIMEAADEDAEIIFGTVIDEEMNDSVKVTVIATGLGRDRARCKAELMQKNANLMGMERSVGSNTSGNGAHLTSTSHSTPNNNFSRTSNTAASGQRLAGIPTMSLTSEKGRDKGLYADRVLPPTVRKSEGTNSPNSSSSSNSATANEYIDPYTLEESSNVSTPSSEGGKEVAENDFIRNSENAINQSTSLAETIKKAASSYEAAMNNLSIHKKINDPLMASTSPSLSSAPSSSASLSTSKGTINNSTTVVGSANVQASSVRQTSSSNRVEDDDRNHAKSIAERLGFINFDDDEFDTPSFLRSSDKEGGPNGTARPV